MAVRGKGRGTGKRMKLLLDMNLSPSLVTHLRNGGHHCRHWSEIGNPTAIDTEIMSYARTHGYVVITNDLDFGAILAATNESAPSVVQIRCADLRPDSIASPILLALQQMAEEIQSGALITVDPIRTRIRVLPFSD
jgi:predicted nuclease of predicted toxin-antitoxin system